LDILASLMGRFDAQVRLLLVVAREMKLFTNIR
jgi:hypothetical protein